MAYRLRRELDVEERIAGILGRFVGQKFNGVVVGGVVRQYDRGLGGRRVDIAVLGGDGRPFLLIETKKKYEARGWRVERRFVVTSEEVLGQVFAYAAILARAGVRVPFVAAANDRRIAVLAVPEDIVDHVDWGAVEGRDYGRVLPRRYLYGVLRERYLLVNEPIRFTEDFFAGILDLTTGIYARRYGVEERRREPHWLLVEDLRGFVDFITPFILDAIALGGRFKPELERLVDEYAGEKGYEPDPGRLAREMAYVLLNKVVFYKVLEGHYDLPPLRPFYREGGASTVGEYLGRLRSLFREAVRATGDFEPVFDTGIYDLVEMVEDEEVLKALDWLVGLLDAYDVARLGDVIGYVYEDLIPAEERHVLGQFYTPRPIAELIVKWAVRTGDDRILDPGCGSGTFLVEAYRRLAGLKLRRSPRELGHVPRWVHERILDQLVGIDVNEFPAHLTAINLAMRNPRAPSRNLNIIVEDYFAVAPGQRRLAPYKLRGAGEDRQAEVVLGDFDAVVGNPPYTRWVEVPGATQERILRAHRPVLSRYGLTPQVAGGVEVGLYVYWIVHSTGFLREGGRLGMIISDSWLQAGYGEGFLRYLLDHYKIHAVIDLSARVFPVPLVGASIVLLERSSSEGERDENNVVFVYLDVARGSMDVDEVLGLVEEARRGAAGFEREFLTGAAAVVRVYKQRGLKAYRGRLVNLLFGADELLAQLRRARHTAPLSKYFEPSFGNILYVYLASKGRVRGVRNVGGEEFFYLSEARAREHGIPEEFLHPLLPSPEYMKYYTFTRNDWEEIRERGGDCYLFLAHKPRSQLPPSVLEYVRLGERDEGEGGIAISKGKNRGRAVAKSAAAQARRRHPKYFYDWYDLGGVVEAPIYAARGVQYWVRFALAEFHAALDDRVIALIPREGVSLTRDEVKAILAFMNSSFGQLQAEALGRSTGGGMIELDVKPLREFTLIDVKRLGEGEVARLAQLFDELESEARRLGGADTAESVFGPSLAGELTGRGEAAGDGVEGLFNTVIKRIDYEVAGILGLGSVVEKVRRTVLAMAKRRISRATIQAHHALKGTTTPAPRRPRRRTSGRRTRRASGAALDNWIS